MIAALHRAGYVAIVGRPNVGKSTLLNRLVGARLSIVSPKPQTTRHRISGIISRENAQIILVDTPGFHNPAHLLGHRMMRIVQAELHAVDVVLLMLDAIAGMTDTDRGLCDKIARTNKSIIVAINKIDRVRKPMLLPLIDACAAAIPSAEIIPISATRGENLEPLLTVIARHLPIGPPLFPPDQLSDQQTRFFIGEMIREQILRQTQQEVPYAVAVTIEAMRDDAARSLSHIQATIVVDRPSHKGILIGHHGQRLKQIGSAARKAIEQWLGRQIYLQLWVKVQKDWRQDARALKELGYSP